MAEPSNTHNRFRKDKFKILEDRIKFYRSIWQIVNTFMESGTAHITHHNVTWVMKASRMVNLEELETKCKYFIDQLCRRNSPLCVYVAARKYGHEDMWKASLNFIRDDFTTLSFTNEFNNLSVADLVDILTDNYIRITSELEVFEAAVRWLTTDWLERFHHTTRVLRCVRFRLMTEEELYNLSVCKDYATIFGISDTFRMLHEAILYVLCVKYNEVMKYRLLPAMPRFYMPNQGC